MADSGKVITTCAIVSIGVGSVNSVAKNKKLPSSRFLIGSGVAFMLLSVIAEAEPEFAKALAIAVATTVVIGEGGGVLSYINNGEMDTAKHQTGGTSHTPKDSPGEHEVSTDYNAAIKAHAVAPYGRHLAPGVNPTILIPCILPTRK